MAADGIGRAKWSLTQEALDSLLAHLSPDRDAAAARYEKIRERLLTFFRCNNCGDPLECADETFDRIARRLPEVRAFEPFLRGVARKVAAESRGRREHQLLSTDDLPAASFEGILEPSAEDRRAECLEACLAKLPAKERALITAYYQFDLKEKVAHRKRLAASRREKTDQLRVEVFRIRAKLRDMIRESLAEPEQKMNQRLSPPFHEDDK